MFYNVYIFIIIILCKSYDCGFDSSRGKMNYFVNHTLCILEKSTQDKQVQICFCLGSGSLPLRHSAPHFRLISGGIA